MSKSELKAPIGILQPKGFPGLPADWESTSLTLRDSQGKGELFVARHQRQSSKEKNSIARVLVIFHGQGEHGGRYLHFTHYLKDEFDSIWCLDHRGHGRSSGVRGHVESFDDYVDDGAHVLEQIYRILEAEKKSERIELTLFGHSMGGLISLRTVFLHTELALRAGLRRLITSAPLLGLAFEVPLLKRAVGQLLARTPLGAFQMETGLDVSATSRDPAVVEAYSHDRLVHSKATSKFYFGMLEAIADTRARKDGLWTPVLALLPQADRLVDPKASLKFFEELQTPHKSIKTFPEYYHESFNDLGKDEVFEEIRKWLRGDSKNSAKLS